MPERQLQRSYELNGRLTASRFVFHTRCFDSRHESEIAKKTTGFVKKILHEMSCTTLSNQIDFVTSWGCLSDLRVTHVALWTARI